jgi:hypothetical protein
VGEKLQSQNGKNSGVWIKYTMDPVFKNGSVKSRNKWTIIANVNGPYFRILLFEMKYAPVMNKIENNIVWQ